MKSPQSEASPSPQVHSANIQRELSQLIAHLEADTRRVKDQRFRGLLEKSAEVLKGLAEQGVQLLALRCAGYNNVDLKAADSLGIKVVRVPAYSPYSVAEHTLALILTLNRKTHRAYNRVKIARSRLKPSILSIRILLQK